MEHIRGIKIQEAISLWREIDPSVKNESYNALKNKIRRAAEKGIIDTAWFSGDGYKLYKNTDVVKFAKSLMKSKPVTNCNQTEQPTSDCSQLPKLTAEVFDQQDCPWWAKWAAVDSFGHAVWTDDKFEPQSHIFSVFMEFDKGHIRQIPGVWDATDWQNSLIGRPVKSLPDWCKVGEWVCTPDYCKKRYEYFKISKILNGEIIVSANGFEYNLSDLRQARLRPWTFAEAPAVLKVKGKKNNDIAYLEFYNSDWKTNWVYCMRGYGERNSYIVGMEVFAENYTQLDGSPCGVLEHFENGEWVK